ncbi:adenylate cyclase [Thermotomaculum hydrothermale]|uniref:Adenylate cyclase n=1 Tax=Thermotomaculum hydrothermale TaxID=981385 RepID=A0A7R6SYB3_9BACT|nr:adenylate/guanylate cyclase domain-containing protein [Thermotomaculum hydrothermale]BBB32455.1 adenylate cyclase [Thermotomaculum hydrothermale]
MIEIEIDNGITIEVKQFENDEIVIGRNPDCDLVLSSPNVSRKHAMIEKRTNGKFYIRDLGSKNGIYYKNNRVQELELGSKTKLTLGPFVITVKIDEIDEEEVAKPFTDSSFVKDIGELTHSRKDLIDVFARIGKLLIYETDLKKICDNLLDIIEERIDFSRGILLLWDSEKKELIPYGIKIKGGVDSSNPESLFSSTITKKAFTEKVGILTTNAMVDPRFSGKQSIMIQGIRSALCVPMWDKDKTIGVIYLDALLRERLYTQEDLKVLSVLASFAAIGIEQVRLFNEMKKQMQIKERLSRYHSPSVVSKLIEETSSGSLKMEEVEASILFADIVDFTSISRKLTPPEIASMLNSFFSKVFGAPNKMDDHAERAVRAAIEMQKILPEFNKETGYNLQIKIGINSGKVVAGDVGSYKRVDYTVLGDTVNIASRLESSVCSPGEIVIGENCYKLIKDRFKIEFKGERKVKGVEKKLKVYRVIYNEV